MPRPGCSFLGDATALLRSSSGGDMADSKVVDMDWRVCLYHKHVTRELHESGRKRFLQFFQFKQGWQGKDGEQVNSTCIHVTAVIVVSNVRR